MMVCFWSVHPLVCESVMVYPVLKQYFFFFNFTELNIQIYSYNSPTAATLSQIVTEG